MLPDPLFLIFETQRMRLRFGLVLLLVSLAAGALEHKWTNHTNNWAVLVTVAHRCVANVAAD